MKGVVKDCGSLHILIDLVAVLDSVAYQVCQETDSEN